MSRTILFVYGTLKTGQANNGMLAGQEVVGPARTLPLYRLHGLGWHPGLVRDAVAGMAVAGELWTVDACGRPLNYVVTFPPKRSGPSAAFSIRPER